MNKTQLLDTVRAFDAAAHGSDPGAASAFTTADATVDLMGQPTHSMREHIEFLRAFGAAFADQKSAHEDWTVEGNRVASRWTVEATHVGPFMGAAATGKRIRFSGIAIVTVRDGKVAHVAGEGDMPGLLRQIGAMPA